MGCLLTFAPILGFIGYRYDIGWLFYIAGGIATLQNVTALLNGDLRCFGSIVTIVCWYTGIQHTGSFWTGLLIGSCVSAILIVLYSLVLILVTAGIGVGIGGIVLVIKQTFAWIGNLFK